MYRRDAKGWLKHLDFMVLDLFVLQVSFVLAYMLRHGLKNPYDAPLYANMGVFLLLCDLLVIFFTEPFRNILKRGYYREMEAMLKNLLPDRFAPRIHHIGSTAIAGIWAKNIVDVLVEIPTSENIVGAAEILKRNGFLIMSADKNRISLNRGYTKEGFADKVYHVHLRYAGDNDELYFRDYLNEYPEAAKEYEALKLSLWKKFEHNRDAYTEAKTDFIRLFTAEARKKYVDRY